MIAATPPPAVDRTAAKRYAAAQWRALRDRLETITPQALGRAALAVVVGVVIVNAIEWTWPALAPFFVGAVIAYALLPVVDSLDRYMPRALAATISVLLVVAVLGGILILVVPPLIVTFVQLASTLPAPADLEAALDRLQAQIGTLPDGSASLLRPLLASIAATVQETLAGASTSLTDLARATLAALLNAVGALLGLIVLPAWMLSLLSQKRRAQIAVDARLAPWLRRDFWALAAIVDRAAGSYLRGYVIVGAIVGVLAYLGFILSPRVGGPTFLQAPALAAIAGIAQIVPIVGPILGFLPALLVLTIDPNRAVAYVLIYIGARLIGGQFIGGPLMQRRIRVPPAILVPGVVLIGQFGLFWLLLSAPIVAIAYDAVRYVHGRLSEPPKPAGVLPGEPFPGSDGLAGTAGVSTPAAVPGRYRPMPSPQPLVSTSVTTPQ